MKLTIKIVSILVLVVLAAPVIIMHGCGAINGGTSGACPDSTAPGTATITALLSSLDAPSTSSSSCYPTVTFTVKDASGAMNGICVELYTNGAIALHTPGEAFPCANAFNGPKTSIVTRTDLAGTVSVELLTPMATTGESFFVEAASGAAVPATVKTAAAP